jgi:hypothetical protein
VNPPRLTILAADTDAACDPETGTCTIPQAQAPSPAAVPEPGTIAGAKEAPGTIGVKSAEEGRTRPAECQEE